MSGVPGLELHHGLMAARGGGGFLLGIWRVVRFKPAVAAAAFWLLFGLSNAAAVASNRPDEVVERRAGCDPDRPLRCSLCPSAGAVSEGQPVPPGCEGGGTVVATQPVSYRRQEGSASRAANLFQFLAMICTIGAVTVFLCGGAGAWRSRRPSRIVGAARRVKREHDRARRDADRVGQAATKLGQRRLEAAGRRWAGEDARGQERTDLNRLDRVLIGKRVAPPKQPKAKRGRKGRRQTESEWDILAAGLEADIAAREAAGGPRLDPGDGPPQAPNASPSPEIAAYRAQAADVESRTAGTMRGLVRAAHEANGWVGYEPPQAPVRLDKEDVS